MSRVIPFLLALSIAAVGCAPKDRDLRLARLAAERRNLESTFDRLEDRLLVNQARVRLWREMRERHESVAAIACVSQEEHAQAMASHQVAPERSSLHRARVAAAAPAGSKPVVRTSTNVR